MYDESCWRYTEFSWTKLFWELTISYFSLIFFTLQEDHARQIALINLRVIRTGLNFLKFLMKHFYFHYLLSIQDLLRREFKIRIIHKYCADKYLYFYILDSFNSSLVTPLLGIDMNYGIYGPFSPIIKTFCKTSKSRLLSCKQFQVELL